MKTKNNTFIITVRLRKGCYRHIKISGDCTFLELAKAILDSFNFDRDHLGVFNLNNKSTDNFNSIGVSFYDKRQKIGNYNASKVTLNDATLEKGSKFLFIYDFGDEWEFYCRVLRVEDEAFQSWSIIKSVGESPDQYPDWDDWDEF